MSLKHPALAIAAAALCVVVGSTAVSAQESCGDLYNRVMGTYQTLGPQSPQYDQMLNYYNARCLSGSSTMPYQTPYAYQQPTPIDPGAAFLGGVVGGVLGEALEGDQHRRYDNDRGRRGW
jgi:hypothetical protein